MSASVNASDLAAGAVAVGETLLVAEVVGGVDRETLKNLADEIVDHLGSGVVALGAEVDGKVALVAKVSDRRAAVAVARRDSRRQAAATRAGSRMQSASPRRRWPSNLASEAAYETAGT